MRFVVVHKVTSYLMVLTSLIALFVSGELHPLIGAVALIAGMVSWWWEPPRVDPTRFERLWNGLTLLMLSKTVLDIVLGEPVLITGAYFVVFLAVNKLFNRSGSRDYLQLYVVSFLQMVAATALSSDLAYGVLFLFYIVFTTWTLILFHLKREMEENYLLKYGDSLQGRPVQVQRVLNSRKLVGGRFLLATSAVSLLVFLGAATFFFLFPRIGFRFFNQQRPGIAMAGFSDTLELGHFGVIKDDPTVVMRVEFPEGDRSALPLYWRGIAFDHYDGRAWTKSAARSRVIAHAVDEQYAVRPAPPPGARVVRQSIYLEPMESRVLFGLSRLHAIELDGADLRLPGRHRGVQIDDERDVHYEQSDEIAFRYDALSGPEGISPALLDQPLAAHRAAVQAAGGARYLQLPDGLNPRIGALGVQVVGDAATVGEAIERTIEYLQREYAYTLSLTRDERLAPLDDFLFEQRQGHCEYFSTAMVVLLRTQGIAARSVNGFLGGTWNSFGGYLAVSQGDAHSWVEVYLPEHLCAANGRCGWQPRWLTRDPTPPAAGPPREASRWNQVLQYADALRMRWYKYVIEYDLQQQMGALVAIRDLWRSLRGDSDGERLGRETRATARRVLSGALAVLVLAGLIGVVWRRRSVGRALEGRAADPSAVAAAALYGELLRIYGRRGYGRPPAMTAREFADTLRRRAAPGLALASEVIDVYERARFGGDPAPSEQLDALTAALRHFERNGTPPEEDDDR